jgi:CheY-like chemotaxis protein
MDFSELFTESARQVLPLARAKGLVSFFDFRGPNIDLALDGDLMRSAMHRLLLMLTASIDQGFVTLSAEAAFPDTGRCVVTVTAAGTGVFAPDETLAGVLQRHGVSGVDVAGPDLHVEWLESMGTRPTIDVALSLHKMQGEGLAITWQAALPARLIDEPAPAQADGAQAWLVAAIPGGLDSVEYRLRRQGWHVTVLQSLQEAQARLDTGPSGGRPMLLMVAESAQATLADLERLTRLSPATWLVLAVLIGSPALQARGTTPVDIRVLPLSRAEIDALARHVDPRSSTARSRQTFPVPQYGQTMRRVLAVDDHPVNQLVARGLLELLGCEVEIAADGQQAIACCRARPPDLVLMDVHMPGLDGLETTRQLRALQRQGVVPPFPIVAATAMHAVQGRQDCLAAGMDGYLEKPLDVRALNDEMHRVLPMQPLRPEGNPTP